MKKLWNIFQREEQDKTSGGKKELKEEAGTSVGGCNGAQGRPRGGTPCLRSGVEAKSARLRQHRSSREELTPPEARGCGQEERPHIQGAVAAQASEGLEELFHIPGWDGRR